MTNKDLTIIITTFRSEDNIEKCLNSIDNSIKVIVVENSNNKIFKKYLENKFSNVDCILTNDNLGYGKANNIALKKVVTSYSLILNPDTTLREDAIDNFFTVINNDLDFSIIAPEQSKKDFHLRGNQSELIKTDKVEGFAMFLNMKKFFQIGFFDENFFLYLEEIDLCKRVKKNNGKIYISPNIKIFHLGARSVNKIFSKEIELTRNWHWMWSLFYYNKKHSNFYYALILVMPILFSSPFKILFYSIFPKPQKKEIYLKRISGLINSILGRASWYRPTLD